MTVRLAGRRAAASTKIARYRAMDLAPSPVKNRKNDQKSATAVTRQNASRYAIDEINAYIAVRDGLLEEAEQNPTGVGIERLILANNFVANCMRPTCHPYITQCLPDVDSVRELKQCHAVDAQIVKLRARLVR
jgi:hypothetical protein